ncbi:MAG: tetratricopeptide repeat protein [Candidatus Riflebacteria bacterium]|nr:tetratricopeptide repeat protein [Candidatus Riflebacteria bacterium]
MPRKLSLVMIGLLLFSCITAVQAVEKTPKDIVLERARDLKRAGHSKQSADVLREAIKKWPDDPKMWLALSYVLESIPDYSGALDALKHVQKLRPSMPNLLPRVRDLEAKISQEKVGKDEYLTPQEQKAKELFLQAVKEKSFGKFDLAFPRFIDVVDLDPRFLDGKDSGMIQAAINYYREQKKSDIPDSYYYLGVYQFFSQNFDYATALFQQYLAKNPSPEMVQKTRERLQAIDKAKAALAESMAQTSQPAKLPVPTPTPKKNVPKIATPTPGLIPVASDAAPAALTGVAPDAEYAGKSADELISEATAAREAGKIGKAINIMTAATQLAPSATNLMALADIYYANSQAGDAGATRSAVQMYHSIMNAYPNSPEANQARKRLLTYQVPVAQRSKEVLEFFQKHGYPDAPQ